MKRTSVSGLSGRLSPSLLVLSGDMKRISGARPDLGFIMVPRISISTYRGMKALTGVLSKKVLANKLIKIWMEILSTKML